MWLSRTVGTRHQTSNKTPIHRNSVRPFSDVFTFARATAAVARGRDARLRISTRSSEAVTDGGAVAGTGFRRSASVSGLSFLFLRSVHRVRHGFTDPLTENTAVAAGLERLGHPAEVVVGADPLPGGDGHRSLHVWLEVRGVPLGTAVPAHRYIVELSRFTAHPHRAGRQRGAVTGGNA